MPLGMDNKDSRHADWVEKLYTRLANEEDARVCKAISEDACRVVSGNFLLLLFSNALTKIGDRLANPKTTLAWLLQALGAPAFFTGIIVPLREAGSLVPQLVIAAYIRALTIRKWVWVVGALLQSVAVACMAVCALTLEGAAAGWALLAALSMFSLSRGLCSIASKDVMGKTIPKTRRGRLKGWMTSASGLVAMGAGGVMILQAFRDGGRDSVMAFSLLLFTAAVLWLAAAGTFAFIKEFPGETEGGGNAITEGLAQIRTMATDAPFRRFVIVRALAMGSGLSAPFIITVAHQRLGGEAWWLGIFILADGLSALLSAPLLGRLADRDSRFLLQASLLSVFSLLLLVILIMQLSLPDYLDWVLFPLLFFVLGIIHSGVRLGRKTYLIDMAEGNRRTTYVAVSNTLIGLALLVVGALTGLLALLSIEVALAFFAACAVAGWGLSNQLPDVSG